MGNLGCIVGKDWDVNIWGKTHWFNTYIKHWHMKKNNQFSKKHCKTLVGEMKSIFKGKLSYIE
jgi:hypothetical protein